MQALCCRCQHQASSASTTGAITHGINGWIARTMSGVEVGARCDPAHQPRPGGQLTAVVDTSRLHLFDPASGQVLDR